MILRWDIAATTRLDKRQDLTLLDDEDPHPRHELARVRKALAQARFVQVILGKHESTEAVLAEEVLRLWGATDRVRDMVAAWREIEAEQRAIAAHWHTQGESFAVHAMRADNYAELLKAQATLLESIFPPHTMITKDG